MKRGEIFQRYGAFWMAETVTTDSNECFEWLKVTAVWSQFGARPIWADWPRTFYIDRRRKKK